MHTHTIYISTHLRQFKPVTSKCPMKKGYIVHIVAILLTVSDRPLVSMGSINDKTANTRHDPAYKEIVAISLCSTSTCQEK